MKHAPLSAKTPLVRDVPLKPGAVRLQRKGPIARPVPLSSSAKPAARITATRAGISPAAGRRVSARAKDAAAKNSGPALKVRRLVLVRDGYACVCCGRSILGQRYSLGHRLRASQGGKPVPSNLLTFLGWGGEACHGRIDNRADPADEAQGFTVRSWQDPADVPVMVFSEHGSGVTVWLSDDGRYVFSAPEPAGGDTA